MITFILRDGDKYFEELNEVRHPGQYSFMQSWIQSFEEADEKHACNKDKPDHRATIEINCRPQGLFKLTIVDSCCPEFEANLKRALPQAFPGE